MGTLAESILPSELPHHMGQSLESYEGLRNSLEDRYANTAAGEMPIPMHKIDNRAELLDRLPHYLAVQFTRDDQHRLNNCVSDKLEAAVNQLPDNRMRVDRMQCIDEYDDLQCGRQRTSSGTECREEISQCARHIELATTSQLSESTEWIGTIVWYLTGLSTVGGLGCDEPPNRIVESTAVLGESTKSMPGGVSPEF
ncbi:hypothetical protein FOZ60_012389 [Perkinsus olseni]|uniref:Uncharacterized protein n=1 Tax=Perkinsus olseni TaxID=32597 RepID=A0A7J6PAG6_PEROL|nr:hypothetical protein FOZ60_012389 [Perkinsus olseni]